MAQKFPDNNFVPAKLGKGLHLVVAEAPGEQESIELEPLVGGAGHRFDALCRAAGLRRDALTLANTLQCRPPNNVYPTDNDARAYISKPEAEAAVTQCYNKHLKPLLESRPWERVTLLGDKALFRLSGQHGIMDRRGGVVPIKDLGGRQIGMPTLHPAYLARDQRFTKVVISDLAKPTTIAPEFYNTHPSIEDVERFNDTTFSFDIENDPKTLAISMVGLTGSAYHAMCVPFRGAYTTQLKRIFANAKEVIGQNSIQHDEHILGLHDVRINKDAVHYDIMLMQHLLMPDLPHDLEFIASILLCKPNWKHLHHADEELYNCRDTDAQFQCWLQLLPMLRQEHLLDLYLNVSVPMARICLQMRETGIKVNPNRIAEVRGRMAAEMVELEKQLPEELRTYEETYNRREPAPPGTLSDKTGKPVKFIKTVAKRPVTPWRSSEVLGEYLYTRLALPKQLHAKTGEVTTDKTALDKLYRRTKRPELLVLRQIKKLSTLMSGFATEAMQRVELVHTHFNVQGTSMGRLSSSDPNLQNIPESARYLYVPRHADWEFMEVDYSQIENRLTAFLADDSDRLARFSTIPGFSEHKYAAAQFLGVRYDEVEKDNDKDAPYGKAKRIVHGCDKGMGARKLANMYDMDEREVKGLMVKWKSVIHKTIEWQVREAERAKRSGVLCTPFGRKLWFYTDNYYTEAIAFSSQSPAADIIFRAMIGLYFERIGLDIDSARRVVPVCEPLPKPAILVLQVHDSNLFEYPREMRNEVAKCVKRVFTQGWPELGGFSIPIGMKVSGSSWGEMEEYDVEV